MRILIIEDDSTLREQLAKALRSQGYAVEQAADGEEGLYQLQEFAIDLAIVDLGLPILSGLEVIEQARAQGNTTPILVLTARGRWQEKVDGLEAGADDYMAKPFEMEELLARMRALLRRTGRWASSTMVCGPIALEPSSHQVTLHGQPIELTTYEFKVLHCLMTHAGEVISKGKLSEHIYEEDMERDSNVMEVFIRRLRKKLDPDGQLSPIETIRGKGYKMSLARQDASS
jgi:two-component system response regulator PhoP